MSPKVAGIAPRRDGTKVELRGRLFDITPS
jgi:hypothetical protein